MIILIIHWFLKKRSSSCRDLSNKRRCVFFYFHLFSFLIFLLLFTHVLVSLVSLRFWSSYSFSSLKSLCLHKKEQRCLISSLHMYIHMNDHMNVHERKYKKIRFRRLINGLPTLNLTIKLALFLIHSVWCVRTAEGILSHWRTQLSKFRCMSVCWCSLCFFVSFFVSSSSLEAANVFLSRRWDLFVFLCFALLTLCFCSLFLFFLCFFWFFPLWRRGIFLIVRCCLLLLLLICCF